MFLVPETLSQCTPRTICSPPIPQIHTPPPQLFFFKFIYLFIFIFGCVGSSFLCEGFLQLWRAGATLHRGARASHHQGPSLCGAQAPDAQAQQLWLTGLVAPRHVGSSQTRARTRVPCIGRQTLNHCATREAPAPTFILEETETEQVHYFVQGRRSRMCSVQDFCTLDYFLNRNYSYFIELLL